MKNLSVFLCVTILMLISAASFAQGTADIEGVVRDAQQLTILPGARITLSNIETGFTRGTISDTNGAYRFIAVPTAGQYTVTAEYSGFRKAIISGIVLRADEKREINLDLKIYESKDVVVTEDRAPLINRVNAEVSSYVTEKQIESIPTDAREINNQLYFLPGVSPATGYFPEAPKVSINGQNSLYTNYMIDGFDNNEMVLGGQRFNTPIGMAQNVAVLTDSYSAEFGRTANGIVNVTTKSGTNDLKGDLFYDSHPGTVVDAKGAFAPKDPITGKITDNGFIRNQFGGSLGGPIVRDKTFFFVDAEITRDNVDDFIKTPVVNATATDQTYESLFMGKIDQHWNADQTTSLRANLGLVGYDYNGGGTTMPSAGWTQLRNTFSIAAKHDWTTSQNSLDETRVQYATFHWNYAEPRNGNQPQVTVLSDSAGTLYGGNQVLGVIGDPGYVYDEMEKTWQLANTYTMTFDRHMLKMGIDFISSAHTLIGGGNPAGNYTVQLKNDTDFRPNPNVPFNLSDLPNASQLNVLDYNVEAANTQPFGTTQNLLGAFAEDSYKPSDRLTINMGLRWDFDNLSKAGSDHYDMNNIGPRLSGNYLLTDDGKSVLRAGYGIYYEKIPYTVVSDAMQFSTQRAAFLQQLQILKNKGILPANTNINAITFNGNASADFPSGVQFLQGIPASALAGNLDSLPAQELRIQNPNGLQNPYSHQISLGFQRQVTDDISFSIDGVLLFGEDLIRLVDVNAPSPYSTSSAAATNSPRSIASADSTRPAGAVVGGARQITMSETGGISRYQGIIVNIKKAFSDGYMFNIAYTLSWNKNNTDDINFRAEDGNNFDQEYGYAVNDRRHVIALTGAYEFHTHTTLSMNVLIQSGQPIDRTVGYTNAEGDGNFYGHGIQDGDGYAGNLDRYPGVPRDGERLPWSKQVDLGIMQPVSVGRYTLQLRMDVFNVFN
ncbi:MAG TPA: carboxypeptidase regulatory-like domain-containing protein, partial [Candidatus Kapabacteria bacterium]|nr:carboxypeptidase regulatory-like domain-containing protein [Candidatus Kapabacteria bacterium]